MIPDGTWLSPCFPKIPDENAAVDFELKRPGKGFNNAEVAKDFHKTAKWTLAAQELFQKTHAKSNVYTIQGYAGKLEFYKIKSLVKKFRDMRLTGVVNPILSVADVENYANLFPILYSLEQHSIMTEHSNCWNNVVATQSNNLSQAIPISAKTAAIKLGNAAFSTPHSKRHVDFFASNEKKPADESYWNQIYDILPSFWPKHYYVYHQDKSGDMFKRTEKTVGELIATLHADIGGNIGQIFDGEGCRLLAKDRVKTGDT
ncbi:hypothetical protein HK100_010599, partial [Physocladia obscura]